MTIYKGLKYDSAKPKMNLLPPKALIEVGKVLTLVQRSMVQKTGKN